MKKMENPYMEKDSRRLQLSRNRVEESIIKANELLNTVVTELAQIKEAEKELENNKFNREQ